MKMSPFTAERLKRRVFGQLCQLALQFVLGMALNLIGSDSHGALRVFVIVILILHILNGIGLFEGNLYIGLRERTRLSWWAFAATTAAFASGILTVSMSSLADVWSFIMAIGFVASAWLNGMLYVRADQHLRT